MPDVKHFDPDAVLDTVIELFWRQGVAATGIQDIVAATGLNRSSLYATFGDKRTLYLTALRRYVELRSQPIFNRLADDDRGLPAVADFFTGLIEVRCAGPYARWGCMVSNAHTGAENNDPDVRDILDQHHTRLRAALRAALQRARSQGQLHPGLNLDATADHLALLAYGINLRSRAGADATLLRATATAVLHALSTEPR
jgi:TetR/AcrR family transcriptional regulator, transcriptional repressor for nem operon